MTPVGYAVVRHISFESPNYEHLDAAREFAARGRIVTNFLPIGYSGPLGIADKLGGIPGMSLFSVALSLLVIASAWFYLRTLGVSRRATLVIAALLSLYPEFVLAYNKAQDTAITAALLFLVLALTLHVLREPRLGRYDLFLGLTLGYAVLVRPNMALLLPLSCVIMGRARLPQLWPRIGVLLATFAVVYLIVTTAFHGRPFFPRSGPYNLYAGNNEYTRLFPLNMEDSLPSALGAHGIDVAALHANLREDLTLRRDYKIFALQYLGAHPRELLDLTWFKAKILMLPDFKIHSMRSLGGLLKALAALAFPLWLLAILLLPHPGISHVKILLLTAVVLYILPFLIFIASPRFRVPLDIFLWVDLAAILWHWLHSSRSSIEPAASAP